MHHPPCCDTSSATMLKLEREKVPFLEEAPGKLEPRWQSTKVKLVKVKLVSCEKLSSYPISGYFNL